jgi:regulatory protein
VALLSRRELSRAELTARLIDRGFARADIDDAIARLTDNKSLDDRRAALAHVRTASRLKGRGRSRIQRELTARGFARELVRDALAEIPADEEANAIRRFIERRHRTIDDSPAGRRRLFNQLLRRGFPAEMILRVLKGLEP